MCEGMQLTSDDHICDPAECGGALSARRGRPDHLSLETTRRMTPPVNPLEPARAIADSGRFANHCNPLQTIAVCALRQPDERRASRREQPVPVQLHQDRASCTPPTLLVGLCSSPLVVCCAAAAVAIVVDRRPGVNPCQCRDRKSLQVIANFSNHSRWCTSEVALVGTAGAPRWSVWRKGFACDSILSRLNDYRQLRLTCAAAA